jgi:hypothetical protein
VFAASSTITIPVTLQDHLDALGFVPADVAQSIVVEHALCHEIHGKDRLKTQRAIARAFIDAVQSVDGFKYSERQAVNKEGSDGTRFKYVCTDSLQNRDRKRNRKQKIDEESDDEESPKKVKRQETLPTYDCGGATINVVYKHNPIHSAVADRPMNGVGDRYVTSLCKSLCNSFIHVTKCGCNPYNSMVNFPLRILSLSLRVCLFDSM